VGPDRLALFTLLGDAYAHRLHGDKISNNKIALEAYQIALETYPAQRNAELWPDAIVRWVQLLFSCDQLDALMPAAIQQVEAVLASNADPYTRFDAINLQFRISLLKSGSGADAIAHYREQLSELQKTLDLSTDGLLIMDIEWRLIHYLEDRVSSKESTELHLNRLIQLSEQFDLTRSPKHYFEAYANIAFLCSLLGRWKTGNQYAAKAMRDIFQYIESDFKGITQEFYELPAGRDAVRELPFCALMAGDIPAALMYFDLVHSRQLDSDVQMLFLISKCVNADSMMHKFLQVKQGQRLLQLPRLFEKEGEQGFSDEPEFKDETKKVATIEKLSAGLERLSDAYPTFTRRHFLEHIDQHIYKMDCWVFMPIFGYNASRFLLIPPKSSIDAVFVSPVYESSFLSEIHKLRGADSEFGWINIFGELNEPRLNQALMDMQAYLWERYGRWIVSVIGATQHESTPHLCIVSNGFLSMFPFALARDPDTGSHLIDFISISYAPSLYAAFSIEERLNSYNNDFAIACVNGKSDPKVPFLKHGAKFVTQLARRDRAVTISGDIHSTHDALLALKNADHWHFSGHGKFGWHEPGASTFDLANGELSASFLEILEPKFGLRLVFLAACETGALSALHSDADAQGFTNRFLSLGALGVVSYLWRLPDISAVLLTERFYRYYFGGGLAPSAALCKAQIWVRDACKADIDKVIQSHKENLDVEDLALWAIELAPFDEADRPFFDPRFWAGATLVGR
jgi:CHAT domain-containing protein